VRCLRARSLTSHDPPTTGSANVRRERVSERAVRCMAGGLVSAGGLDIARARGYGRVHARGERASGEKRERALQQHTVVVAVTLAHAHCRAPVHSRARARTAARRAHAFGTRTLGTGVRRRRLWCGDGRRASGKMSAHWSGRNMTWKIINMVRGGGGGDCSSGQRSAAAARQCCRLTVKNIPPVSEMRFLPRTGAPLAFPSH